jgi:hypothetical protein
MDSKTCFVIMPFSQTHEAHSEAYWTQHFEAFLKPLIEESGDLKVSRSKALRGDLVKEIVENLYNSNIVVADLTDRNPNVFWELGVRQSFKHGTITIVEEGTELPFDISTKGTLYYYPGNHIKLQEFRTQFKKAIRDCLDNPDKPDSRVLDILPGRLSSHLAPPISFNVLPVYYENDQPRTSFIITNLGPLPAKVKITVRAFLGKKDIGLIRDAMGYYSGQTKWNLDAGFQFRGNFALRKEAIESKAKLRLEVKTTVFDIHDQPHEKLPLCFTYVKDKNYWYTEPTSFSEIKRFIK